jgi:micrococcal nuclease
MLDVDTPESVKKNVRVQEFGKEASEFTNKTLLDKAVKLVFEKDIKDRYGRLLAYIILKDNSLYNAVLVRNGYARVEIVSPNTSYSKYFNTLQDEAVKDKTGLWKLPSDKQPFVKRGNGRYVPRYLIDKSA